MLTDKLNINLMAMNLTNYSFDGRSYEGGLCDLTRKIEVDVRGKTLDLKVSKG